MLAAWGRVYVCKSEGSEDCSFATESSYPRPATVFTLRKVAVTLGEFI